MTKPVRKDVGLAEVLSVTMGSPMPDVGEGECKLLGFFLRHGECTAEISESTISVWYSWLPRPLPSRYFLSLAPGLVSQLMRLGNVDQIGDEATFQIEPGIAGKGRYVFDVSRKWVRIRCEEKRIIILVRDKRKDLSDSTPKFFIEAVRCERCNGELRTPLAKQCLHCGFDWH